VITEDLLPVLRTTSPGPDAKRASGAQVAVPVEERGGHTGAHIIPFDEAERRAIVHALQISGWRISGQGGAAEMLGLKPTTLHAKMKKLGIRRPSAAAARLRA
jgi:transcriptional regulator with GAF, ATPase, and Fis domain